MFVPSFGFVDLNFFIIFSAFVVFFLFFFFFSGPVYWNFTFCCPSQ